MKVSSMQNVTQQCLALDGSLSSSCSVYLQFIDLMYLCDTQVLKHLAESFHQQAPQLLPLSLIFRFILKVIVGAILNFDHQHLEQPFHVHFKASWLTCCQLLNLRQKILIQFQ